MSRGKSKVPWTLLQEGRHPPAVLLRNAIFSWQSDKHATPGVLLPCMHIYWQPCPARTLSVHP